ncbi:Zn-dependent M28 family amino/carboxypeptidase [Sphingomonas vulcanisoli]|uniref:Zn-dependent M28 family amino/carboxypeptidase n=1 Tax=Sphingomonas vulcanisoli TaxID=1658060 RepID=A0ABX0TNB5_9SPHN|nr:M28 family metallopeptidase [Sphingomonas vulcanisoli]NIJ07006.1 Zn-dependent M28 family amino/carboxypeptidase [Sphingomonas vulcanisoli]
MRIPSLLLATALPAIVAAQPASPPSPRAAAWWGDISVLADDKMEGRLTGSPGYLRAAAHVEARMKALGLQPAGEAGGYRQSVAFEQQRIDAARSKASLLGADGKVTPLPIGDAMIIGAGGGPRPVHVDAPLVFVGYGLRLPQSGYDDFKGLDLRGKIAVVIAGGPADLPGPAKSAARNARNALLGELGAVGVIGLTPPKQVEIPWARTRVLASQSGMYLADKALRETPDDFLSASFDPAQSEALFAGSGHSFAELAAVSDASGAMPTFALPARLQATIAASRSTLTSPNVIAKLEGSDPKLRDQYVVLSAHLDHLGIGEPIAGDRIYNGAMDDASGVASVLDIAERIAKGPRPKRSILFVIVTAEEKGLLGSTYYARRPTVPKTAIVADLNFDMPLPLWPLKTVLVQGDHESTLGDPARAVAAAQGLRLIADPLPNRNSFVRTDQFSFVKAGVPALSFKFGFEPGTPEFQIEHDWRATRYHAPSDDLNQPVMKEEAIKLDDYVAALAVAVANDPARPAWLPTSPFRAYAEAK